MGRSGRDEPADFAADRAGNRNFPLIDIPKDLIPDFAMSIRSTDECWAVEYSFHVLEVDLVIAQIALALLRVPVESANAREQRW